MYCRGDVINTFNYDKGMPHLFFLFLFFKILAYLGFLLWFLNPVAAAHFLFIVNLFFSLRWVWYYFVDLYHFAGLKPTTPIPLQV